MQQYAAVHTLVLLMMGIMMPETCWDKSLIIKIRLVASCWFLSLHPTIRYFTKNNADSLCCMMSVVGKVKMAVLQQRNKVRRRNKEKKSIRQRLQSDSLYSAARIIPSLFSPLCFPRGCLVLYKRAGAYEVGKEIKIRENFTKMLHMPCWLALNSERCVLEVVRIKRSV